MKTIKKLIPAFFIIFFLSGIGFAADYAGDTKVNSLSDVGGVITTGTRILAQDMNDVDKVGFVDPADILGLIAVGDIPTLTGTIILGADCSGITAGVCLDTDNGYLYSWDGDSVELVGVLNYEAADATIIKQADVDDTAVNGEATVPVSSNWAFDHDATADAHHTKTPVDDTPNNGDTTDAVSSNWAYDHVAAADPHTGYLTETTYDAQTILQATSDSTPVALTVGEQTLVGRITAGNITALTATQVRTLLNVADGATAVAVDDTPNNGDTTDAVSSNWAYDHAAAADPHAGYTLESLFNAQTILQATSDNTPAALTVAEQTLVGRITAGNITALTATEVRTLLNVADGADVTSTNETSHTDVMQDGDFSSIGRMRRTGAGAYASWVDNLAAAVAPGVTDDTDPAGYSVGSIWIDTTADKAYVCLDPTNGAAVWIDITQSSSAPATADISDVTVTQTELAELQEIGATTISAAQWAGVGAADTFGISVMAATDEDAFQALITSPWADGDVANDITASSYVPLATYDAQSILQATSDDTPAALTVTEQTVVGRATGGNIAALVIDSDLSSVSANDDTIPSAKATKAYADSVAVAPTNVTPVETGEEDAAFYPILVDGLTGSQATETDDELSYNPSTDTLTVHLISAGAGGMTVDADGDTVVKSMTVTATAAPGWTFLDSDGLGADKEAGQIRTNMIIVTDGAEDSDLWINIMQAGTRTTVLLFDESDDRWEIPTGKGLAFGTTQWDDGSDKIDGEQLADNTVDDDSIDFTDVNADDLGDGSTNAIITLTQETNFETAYSASHTQGTDTALGAMAEDIDMNTDYQIVGLQAPAAPGEAIRATADITETALISVTDGGDTTEHDHDGISENTSARHAAVTLNASATTGGLGLATQEITYRAATNAQTGYATAAHITALEAVATAVLEADYNAHTVLQATSDNTPVAITIAEQQIVGRITAGNIKGLSVAEIKTLIGNADTETTGLLSDTDWDTFNNKAATTAKLDDFGTPDDNTDLNVTTTYHGLMVKLPDDATKVFDGSGSWVDVEDLADEIAAGIAEGELANSVVIGADIKDDTIDSDDYAANSIDPEHLVDDFAWATFPTTPAAEPDANYEVANKKYVDDNIGGVVERDIVTTAPLTIDAGANLDDILPGSGADITFAITILKDVVATAPLLVNATTNVDDILPGADADLTISLDATADWATTGTITGRLKWGTDVSGSTNHDVAELHGLMYLVTAASTITLDAPADTGYGGNACYVIRDAAEAVIIDIDGSTKLNLDGTAQAVGVGVTATGAGEKICVIASTDVDGSGGDGYYLWGNTSEWASQ